MLSSTCLVSWLLFFLLQYNEILGKGASKTVYEILFSNSSLFRPSVLEMITRLIQFLLYDFWVVVVTEHLMSTKGLKWHGIK